MCTYQIKSYTDTVCGETSKSTGRVCMSTLVAEAGEGSFVDAEAKPNNIVFLKNGVEQVQIRTTSDGRWRRELRGVGLGQLGRAVQSSCL